MNHSVHINPVPQPSSREKFLEAGLRLLARSGFNATGLQAILDEGAGPKGSFYNYFGSKEEFAVEVLDLYGERFGAIAHRHLGNARKGPLARLRAYFEELVEVNAENGFEAGCLLGNLGQEVSSQSETLRKRIDVGFRLWRAGLTECLREAIERRELVTDLAPETLADFVLNAWEGALLQMKVRRDRAPLDHFLAVVFGSLLAAR